MKHKNKQQFDTEVGKKNEINSLKNAIKTEIMESVSFNKK